MTQVNTHDKDPYFFDREDLQAIADAEAIRRGLNFYKENRVIEVDQDHTLLWGQVLTAHPEKTVYLPDFPESRSSLT